VAKSLHFSTAPIATLCWPITSLESLNNPNVVKVVRTHDEHALYFSRSPIPFHRDDVQSFSHTYRHIGLYAYRAAFLLEYVSWPSCALEQAEALEQLRVLWAGFPIKVEIASEEPLQDINTLEDLEIAKQLSSL
jgi:3-deoxy-manno-octulosonate cytidylyltransferase (CMP-KDO synthetase)